VVTYRGTSASVSVTATADKTFTVGYERGTIVIKNAGGETVTGITLSKSSTPSTITLSADGAFSGVAWYVDGVKDTSSSLTLNAANYTVKIHSVTFTGWRNGTYLSSGPIPFTVAN
jgi:hypothetical protein